MADALVRLTPRGSLDIVQVATFGDAAETAERLSKHFGVAITAKPNRAVAAAELTVLWHGPGTSVDLRPAHFAPGACALTALCKIGALLHAVARDTIDVYVPRSYEQALAEWMEHAGRGVTTASL